MRGAGVGLAAVLLTASCEDACWKDDYDFVWSGEHVTVYGYGYDEAAACGGSFAELDGHTAMIRDELGLNEAQPSVYRWISPGYWEELGDPCLGLFACAWFGEVMSPVLPHMHEVVHTITDHIGSDGCPRLLDEGLAMVYDAPTPTSYLYPTPEFPLRDLMADGVSTHGLQYVRAAHFVSYLVETYGQRSIVELCEALPREPSLERWEAAIPAILGVTLEELLADYDLYPWCTYPQMRARLWGCSASPDFTFAAVGDELVVEAGCEDNQATNGAWDDAGWDFIGDALLLRRVSFTKDTRVKITVRSLGPSGLRPTYASQECASCSQDPDVFVLNVEEATHLYRAGQHEISVYFDKRDQVRLTMTVEE